MEDGKRAPVLRQHPRRRRQFAEGETGRAVCGPLDGLGESDRQRRPARLVATLARDYRRRGSHTGEGLSWDFGSGHRCIAQDLHPGATDAGCAPCLFGWHALSEGAYRSRAVVLTEGQIDCMSWHQWGIPALSIPNGSGLTWIDYDWENLAAFDRIYISFDMDGAGRENTQKAIQRLGPHRCHVMTMPHKDGNAALQAGATAEDAQRWL